MIAQEMVPDEMSAPTAESPGQFNKITMCNFVAFKTCLQVDSLLH
jgi:hypothetical protein